MRQTSDFRENFLYLAIEECRIYMQQTFQIEGEMAQRKQPAEAVFKEPPQEGVKQYAQPPKSGEGTFCEQEQGIEVAALQKAFASFRMAERADVKTFVIRLSPVKNEKAIMVMADIQFALPPQYPYDWPEISVNCVKNHGTKRNALGLRNFLASHAQRHHGRRQVFELIERARKWLGDQNNFELIKQGYEAFLEVPSVPEPEPADPVIDLQQFELDGKLKLVNLACTSVVTGVTVGNLWTPRKMEIVRSVYCVVYSDPEFVLQLALYIRTHLGVRETANFILALACNIRVCHPYVRSYFGSIVRLPTDMLHVVDYLNEIPEYARVVKSASLPNCLREAIKDKFPDFDEYQLAKHCSENSRKRLLSRRKIKTGPKSKKPYAKGFSVKAMQWDAQYKGERANTTMKRLIRQVHLVHPRELVLKVIRAKYPDTLPAFESSGLPGEWDPSRANQRLKLEIPETWEALLSQRGNSAAVWEYLLDHNKLPFLAMIRNLRNILYSGISLQHHHKVIGILLDEHRVAASLVLPSQFLSAYASLDLNVHIISTMKKFLTRNLKSLRSAAVKDRDFVKRGLLNAELAKKNEVNRLRVLRRKVKAIYGVPIVAIPQFLPTKKLLSDYRHAVDVGMRLFFLFLFFMYIFPFFSFFFFLLPLTLATFPHH